MRTGFARAQEEQAGSRADALGLSRGPASVQVTGGALQPRHPTSFGTDRRPTP